MSFGLALALIALSGAVASCLAWRAEHLSATAAFRWGGLALWVFLLVLMRMSIREIALSDILLIVIVCACWSPFVAFFIVNTLGRITRSALSLDDLPRKPGFSQAQALAAKGNVDEALRLYREVAAEFPEDPDPQRYMAELLLKHGCVDEALAAFRRAQELSPDPEQKAVFLFSIAETLVDHRGDIPGALALLRDFLKRYPDSRSVPFVERRIELLRQRPGGGEVA